MPGLDIFTFLGPVWLTIIGIVIIGGMILCVIVGTVIDYRDWRRRPPRVKKK